MSRGKYFFKCIDCGSEYRPHGVHYLCPNCEEENCEGQPQQGVLKVQYHFNALPSFNQLKGNEYVDLLPIVTKESLPNLRVGNTPVYNISCINNSTLPYKLYIKDDSQNPTFSFKDRASAVVSAYAKENNISTIVAASTGNAGSSLAGICASQGQRSIIMVPASAPIAKLTQIIMYGATVVPVKGTYDDAFDLSMLATKEFGWYNRNTAYNPYTIEGKKTAAFELFDQLGQTIPDRIFVPVGDGVIISGIYKGFEDLLNLGIIDKVPIIVAVQSEGSQNLVSNLNASTFNVMPSKTIADSISVDVPRNFNMTKQFINKYDGETVIVSDSEIISASSSLSRSTGVFAEPAAAAAFAGMLKYHSACKIPAESKNVVLLTGSGLKDLKGVESVVKVPNSIEPNIRELRKIAKKI
ncbi:MAG: threonine synthase [Bacteroidales bacterium]